MSIDTLARETRMSLDQAQEFLDRFYQKFPTMKAYIDQIKDRLHETGHLQSLLGRSLEFDLNRLKSRESIKRQVKIIWKHYKDELFDISIDRWNVKQ